MLRKSYRDRATGGADIDLIWGEIRRLPQARQYDLIVCLESSGRNAITLWQVNAQLRGSSDSWFSSGDARLTDPSAVRLLPGMATEIAIQIPSQYARLIRWPESVRIEAYGISLDGSVGGRWEDLRLVHNPNSPDVAHLVLPKSARKANRH